MKWLALALGLAAACALPGCGSPARSAPADAPPVPAGPSTATADSPAGPPAPPGEAPTTGATGTDRPDRSTRPETTRPATSPRSESENALRALDRSAGLDSPLKRKIQQWDRAVEAGMQAQARVRWNGPDALEPLRKQLQARVDTGQADVVDLYLLGRLHGKLGHVDRARQCFQQALQRDAEFIYAYEGLAVCEAVSGERIDEKTILAPLEKAFRIWGDFPRGHLMRGRILIAGRKPDAGLAALARIPEDHPVRADAAVAATKAYQQLGKLDMAVNRLAMARKKAPDNIDLAANHGLLLVQLAQESGTGPATESRLEEAETTLAHVLTLAPHHPEARFGLALVRLQRGKREEAHSLLAEVAGDADLPRTYRQEAARWLKSLEQGAARPRRSATEVLAQLENDPDPERRREAASLLVRVRARPVLVAFARKLEARNEPDEGVRVFAVKALGSALRPEDLARCFTPLLDPKQEPSRLVRGAAAGALKRVPLKQAPLAALVRALEDPEPYVFREVRTTLQELTGERFHLDFGSELTPADRARVIQAWKAWYQAWSTRHESRKG